MRFLRPTYLYIASPGSVVDSKRFLDILQRVELNDGDFNTELFKPGTSGETALYQRLMEDSNLDNQLPLIR